MVTGCPKSLFFQKVFVGGRGLPVESLLRRGVEPEAGKEMPDRAYKLGPSPVKREARSK